MDFPFLAVFMVKGERKMKKRVLIAAAALVLCLGTATAFAAGPGRNFKAADGVCEYRQMCNQADENGCGRCFADENEDGVCDFRNTCARAGRGWGCIKAQ
jgi:hypothetical protein